MGAIEGTGKDPGEGATISMKAEVEWRNQSRRGLAPTLARQGLPIVGGPDTIV